MKHGMSQLDRAVYKQLQDTYKKEIIAPHTLRLEQVITNANSTYAFSILEDQSNKTKSEIRLNKNDILFCTAIGYGIVAVNMTATPANSKDSKSEIATYPNATIFADVTVSSALTFDHTDLEVFWKSVLTLKVGSTEYIPGLETDIFRYVPETQKSSASNYDMYSSSSGFMELPTYYSLRGDDEIKFAVNVNVYAGILVANTNTTTENRLVLRPRGFIIRGGVKKIARTSGE